MRNACGFLCCGSDDLVDIAGDAQALAGPKPARGMTTADATAAMRGAMILRDIDDPTIILPRIGEVWRATNGATREIVDVAETYVSYRRPAPAPAESLVVSGRKWREWIETQGAVRVRKTWRAP